MSKMTPSHMQKFLDAPHHAILATIRKTGTPQLSPVWYIFEDGLLYISCLKDSAKHHNIKRDPRITVCIDGGSENVQTVILSGSAEITSGADPSPSSMRWRIIRKYTESDEAATEYENSAEIQNNILLTLNPSKIITQDFR